MKLFLTVYSSRHVLQHVRHKSTYKLLVVGAGSGGAAIANKLASKLGKDQVAVIEPSKDHYYQPMWTLVGAGIKDISTTRTDTASLLPKTCDWIQEKAAQFNPDENTVTTDSGKVLNYEYLVVAMGLQLDFHKIPGLQEALTNDPSVVSNYSPEYVLKTHAAIQACTSGNAIFTFPNTPIKCPGAPQKIAYLAEEIFCKNGTRKDINVIYNTILPRVFGIPRYANALDKIIASRNIKLNTRTHLLEVRSESKEVVLEHLDTQEKQTLKYSLLHVGPPCSAPDPLKASCLGDAAGFLDVNPQTLQHKKYPNVFGIGDCTNVPTAKTGAAVAAQTPVLARTLENVMNGKPSGEQYTGYTSCPLVTRNGRVILAEFGYEGKIMETFPWDQSKERWTMYFMKAHILPKVYFWLAAKGLWSGPKAIKKMFDYLPGPSKT